MKTHLTPTPAQSDSPAGGLAYTCARLTSGTIVRLRKDCECATHTGPHWMHADQSWKAANRPLLAAGTVLGAQGFAIEERARLAELGRAFAANGIAQLLTDADCEALRAGGEAIDTSRAGLRPAIKRVIGLSYNDVERIGLGWRTFAGWRACWEWCAVRLGGEAGRKHEAFWERHGSAAYYARINRVRKACGFAPLAQVGGAL